LIVVSTTPTETFEQKNNRFGLMSLVSDLIKNFSDVDDIVHELKRHVTEDEDLLDAMVRKFVIVTMAELKPTPPSISIPKAISSTKGGSISGRGITPPNPSKATAMLNARARRSPLYTYTLQNGHLLGRMKMGELAAYAARSRKDAALIEEIRKRHVSADVHKHVDEVMTETEFEAILKKVEGRFKNV
jgi:hypothetical protein